MEKYDAIFILSLETGEEVVLVRDITVPVNKMISELEKKADGATIEWTAFTKSKKVIDSGTINPKYDPY